MSDQIIVKSRRANRMPSRACMDCVLAAVKEQLSPGVTRIHGNLCNVHGRWARCPGAPTSKRVPMKRLPAAPRPGKRAGGKKGAAARKPIKTDAQREQERQAKRQQAQQQRQAEHEQNQAKVLHDLGIPEDAAGALSDLAAGKPIDDDGGLVKMGLAEIGRDGQPRLTTTAHALLSAAKAGDTGRARDAIGRAADQVAGRTERQQAADERKRAADQRKADVEKRRVEAARLRAERLAKKRGGGKGKKPPVPKTAPPPARVTSSRIAPVRGGGSAPRQAPPAKPKLAPELVNAARQLSNGAEIDDTTAALLIRNGLARYNKDGVLVLTTAGQRATMKTQDERPVRRKHPLREDEVRGFVQRKVEELMTAQPTMSYDDAKEVVLRFVHMPMMTGSLKAGNLGDYLVVEDRTKPSTWHLQVKRNGTPDHGLMGAAWAALHGGFRGNVYQGPNKGEALAKLKRLYEQEDMDLPSGKSFAVFKDASGAHRWISRTTTSYRDRDGEIISEKALEEDAQRMTATEQYGPLRYWHVGKPDPLSVDAPWGPGLDIGDCDFSIVIGRTSIESGTFKAEAIGKAFADDASSFELSPGFFHAATEPDAATGVFDHLRRFERSTVPTKHGRASNLFTGLTVKEHSMDQATYDKRVKAYLDFAREKGIPPEAAAAPIVAMEQADKEAGERQIAYKEEKPGVIDMFRAFFTGETIATKEETPAVAEPSTPHAEPPDPITTLKEELAALRAEIASLKAPMDMEDDPAQGGDAGVDEAAEGEPPVEGDGGLTLSSDDLAAMGQMFGGVLQSALEPLVGALGITQKIDTHMGELKSLMSGYVKQKEAGDGERANQVAALKATIDQQQAAITESQAKLTELLGDQPRNAGYRPSQAADNGAEAVLTAIKDGPPEGGTPGPFDDLISNLFPGLAQGGKP